MTENTRMPAPPPTVDRTRPWARRLAAGAAAVALSLGGAAVTGAAAVRLETDTVAVAGPAPTGATPVRVAGTARFGAATVVVVRRSDR